MSEAMERARQEQRAKEREAELARQALSRSLKEEQARLDRVRYGVEEEL